MAPLPTEPLFPYPTGSGFVANPIANGLTMVVYDFKFDDEPNGSNPNSFSDFDFAPESQFCADVSVIKFLDTGSDESNTDPTGGDDGNTKPDCLDKLSAGDANQCASIGIGAFVYDLLNDGTYPDFNFDFVDWGTNKRLSETIAIKFCGFITIPSDTTTVKFKVIHDDGTKMFLNGVEVLSEDSLNNFGETESVLIDEFPEDNKFAVNLEIFENTFEVNVVLLWSLGGGEFELVPSTALSPAEKNGDDIPFVCLTEFQSGKGNCGGDPHFKRFGQEARDSFHGECDLVLAHSENFYDGAGLDVHVRTTMRDFYSYIESAAVKIGKHILEVQKNSFLIDGTPYDESDLPLTFGENGAKYTLSLVYQTKERRHYLLNFGNEATILFRYYKQFMNVDVDGHYELKDNKGLLGSYPRGDMVGRSGDEIKDFVDFGFEWQVNPEDPQLFSEARAPQLPYEKCRLPTGARPSRRHLRAADKKLHQQAQEACASQSGSDFDLCVEDVMLTGDLGIADLW